MTNYFKDFKFSVLFFRVATVALTAFLGTFCKAYNASPDVNHALHAGLDVVWQSVWAALGLDQLIYSYTSSTK